MISLLSVLIIKFYHRLQNRITTIEQPIDEMARKVVDLMMDKIHTKIIEKELYEFELELLVKGSTMKDTMLLA